MRAQFSEWGGALVRWPSVDATAVAGLLVQWAPMLALVLAAWLVLVPVALYVVFSRD